LIDIEIDDQIALITIDNPPMNAVCKEMLDELDSGLEEIHDEDVRIVIVTGEGNAFVAGADIKEMKDMDPKEAREFSRRGQKIFNKLQDLSLPVIGAVNGYALGGGLELALSCDLIVASEEALFGQPEVGLGIIPGFGGTYKLEDSIGEARAKELIFTGRKIDAERAREWGLVNRVVESDETLSKAQKIAEDIKENSPIALEKAKQIMNQNKEMSRSIKASLKVESDRFEECFRSSDQKEGMEAFLEERDPQF